ncbi:MFS transporter [Candidatus Velamenicoccus archaeovorus]|uniref:MFS transporter n=1 Tax=Velamenicoccus archaeovorus TaxID=1930593 RepID=A0A410P5Y3_VELA1|nr:DHA2 family efflux MFS transporter permease subunit [Candidatus Velamenicoccus archaeovorus]QAT17570.1 MFS transporter [Candidatus Velamenicoccus archaeovorus]
MVAESPAHGSNKWMVTTAVMLGAFLSVMDTSIVNVALPYMMGNFAETLSAITWIATIYTIAAIIVITMTGWLSALMGRKNLYLFSFILFTIGSVLCGTAKTFPQMLIYRIIQGIGGGALIPISQAILRETFPRKQHGMAMAIFGMGIVLAPALGPIVGGWLIDHYGWPWIFYINIPISLVGIWMVYHYVHDPEYLKRGIKKVDWFGISFLMVGLTALQIVLERGQEKNWFDSTFIITWSIVSVVALLALIFWELWTDEPVVNLRILRNVPFAIGFTVVGIYGIALYGTTFILPQLTQSLLGYSAYQSGLTLLPRALTLFIFMPLAGRLYNHIDAKKMIILGIGVSCWSYALLGHLSLNIAFESLVPILLLMGAGMAFVFVPLSTVSLITIPNKDMTNATSLYTLMQRIGGNVGYAVTVTILQRRMQFHRSHLVENISASHGRFLDIYHMFTGYLHKNGYGPVSDRLGTFSFIDHLINRQSTMLSYNDLSWIFMLMFAFVTLFILFLPHSRTVKSTDEVALID